MIIVLINTRCAVLFFPADPPHCSCFLRHNTLILLLKAFQTHTHSLPSWFLPGVVLCLFAPCSPLPKSALSIHSQSFHFLCCPGDLWCLSWLLGFFPYPDAPCSSAVDITKPPGTFLYSWVLYFLETFLMFAL